MGEQKSPTIQIVDRRRRVPIRANRDNPGIQSSPLPLSRWNYDPKGMARAISGPILGPPFCHHHHENSHIWLSLGNAKVQIKNIKNGLVKEFPQYETKIEENYSDYIKRLNALEDERRTVLSLSKELNVISFHGAFEYMAEDLGLNICHTIESDEGHEPPAKELAQLSNKIKKDSIKALFVDPNYNGSAAEILGRETGEEIYVINPVISGKEKLTAYEDIMNENYQMILKAVK